MLGIVALLTALATPSDLPPGLPDGLERAVFADAPPGDAGAALPFRLDAREAPGGALELRLPFPAGERQVLLRRAGRAPGFRLRVAGDAGLVEAPAPRPDRWQGALAGGGVVRVGRVATGFAGFAVGSQGALWSLEAPARAGGQHRLRQVAGAPPHAGLAAPVAGAGGGPGAPAGGPRECLRAARLAVDVDFEYFAALGQDLAATVASVEATVDALNVAFARDLGLVHELGEVIVRTSEPDPYSALDSLALLQQLRHEWNTTQAGVERDLVHLFTGKLLQGGVFATGTLASVCDLDQAYSLATRAPSTAAQALRTGLILTRAWGAGCVEQACTLPCFGCALAFAPAEQELVLEFAAGLDCLEAAPGLSDPLPPNARDDAVATQGALRIDVLANDLDGNCDALAIAGFDATSAAGGSVALSPGTGPDGRDELLYTPPGAFTGSDSFAYSIIDASGLGDGATVSVEVGPCDAPASYCTGAPNSVGPGAVIASSGSTSVATNDLVLSASGCPPGQSALFFYGPSPTELPFGNGFRCVGGALQRLPVVVIDGAGGALWPLDLTSPPTSAGRIEPGSSWYFQLWYRDPAAGGAAFNTSDGLAAQFCP